MGVCLIRKNGKERKRQEDAVARPRHDRGGKRSSDRGWRSFGDYIVTDDLRILEGGRDAESRWSMIIGLRNGGPHRDGGGWGLRSCAGYDTLHRDGSDAMLTVGDWSSRGRGW